MGVLQFGQGILKSAILGRFSSFTVWPQHGHRADIDPYLLEREIEDKIIVAGYPWHFE